ncbi:ATP/GTP-binding protein [Streptomyces sp. NPDC004230]
MLTGRLALRVSGALAVIALVTPAYADGPKGDGDVKACDTVFVCVDANAPGDGGGQTGNDQASSNGDSSGKNTNPLHCTYRLADPQPPANSLDWEGHKPGDGAVYVQVCQYLDSTLTVERMVWAADPPQAPAIDPAVLAQQAVDKMRLLGPDIGITPKPGGRGVIGMPVYMWTAKGAETYGPNTASASAGGITVTATAKVSKIVWKMGDGQAVTCTSAGTPYKAAYGKQASPDCGYRYSEPSSTTSTGKYHVTATSTWTIDWQVAGGGQTGQLAQTRSSAVDITVAEVQVLN